MGGEGENRISAYGIIKEHGQGADAGFLPLGPIRYAHDPSFHDIYLYDTPSPILNGSHCCAPPR